MTTRARAHAHKAYFMLVKVHFVYHQTVFVKQHSDWIRGNSDSCFLPKVCWGSAALHSSMQPHLNANTYTTIKLTLKTCQKTSPRVALLVTGLLCKTYHQAILKLLLLLNNSYNKREIWSKSSIIKKDRCFNTVPFSDQQLLINTFMSCWCILRKVIVLYFHYLRQKLRPFQHKLAIVISFLWKYKCLKDTVPIRFTLSEMIAYSRYL